MAESRSVGRPTKYNDDMQQRADDYVYEWAEAGDMIPSRVGLCRFIGINKTTSYDWEHSHSEFSHTLKAVETLQEYVALNKGVVGEFNSTIVKLIMANFGYSDKSEIDHTSGGKQIKSGISGFYAEVEESDEG